MNPMDEYKEMLRNGADAQGCAEQMMIDNGARALTVFCAGQTGYEHASVNFGVMRGVPLADAPGAQTYWWWDGALDEEAMSVKLDLRGISPTHKARMIEAAHEYVGDYSWSRSHAKCDRCGIEFRASDLLNTAPVRYRRDSQAPGVHPVPISPTPFMLMLTQYSDSPYCDGYVSLYGLAGMLMRSQQ